MAGYTFPSSGFRYVDYDNGIDTTVSGYGTKMSTPWRTFGYAVQNTPSSYGLFARRGTTEVASATITQTSPDSNPANPSFISSWPRPPKEISCTFKNGERVVYSTGITELGCVGRTFTYDNSKYLITKIVSSATFATDPDIVVHKDVTVNVTLDADPLYVLTSGFGVANGADVSGWSSGSDDIFALSFNGAYEWFINGVEFQDHFNIAVTGTIGSSYMVREYYTKLAHWQNCYFKCTNDDAVLFMAYCSKNYFNNCIFEGINGYDTDQNALYVFGQTKVQNCVCVSVGNRFIISYGGGQLFVDNCKAPLSGRHVYRGIESMFSQGVEHSVINSDFKDCANADIYTGSNQTDRFNIINYNRTDGDNRQLLCGAGWAYADSTTFAGKNLLKLSFNRWSTGAGFRSYEGWDSDWHHGLYVVKQNIYLDEADGPWTIRYNAYNGFTTSGTSDHLWLEVLQSSDSNCFDSGYGSTLYKSTQGISSSGWGYIEATGITGGYLTSKVYFSRNSSTYSYWLDPQPEIRRG